MTKSQRSLFAKGLIDLGNIGAGALVFGQFISERQIEITTVALGIILTLSFYFASYRFSKIKEK